MRFKKYKELLLGIAILTLSIIYFYATTLFKIKIQTPFGSQYIPFLLAGIAFILGIVQCINGYRIAKRYEEKEEEAKDIKAVILMFCIIVAYIIVLKRVGFLISTTVLMFLQMTLLAPKEKWNLPIFGAISILATVVIYYSFRLGLRLMLPGGMLG